jgi:hypothetical protein
MQTRLPAQLFFVSRANSWSTRDQLKSLSDECRFELCNIRPSGNGAGS